MDRPELREVLETHLRGPVLPDRDTRMGAAEPERRTADRRHANEVVRAAQERCEGRAERLPPEHLHPHSGRHHLLLRDVHLDEPLGMGLGEDLRERRIRDLAIEHHDVPALAPEGGERLAIRLPRRDLAAHVVRRPLAACRLEAVGLPRLGSANLDPEVADAPELGDRLLGDRLAVPAVLVLDLRVALPLDGSRDDRGRTAGRGLCLAVRSVDRLDVVPVDLDRVPAERLEAPRVRREIPAVHRLAALPQPVHVDDRRQVVELVERGVLGRLPHRALGHLAVPADDPDAERQAVEPLACDCHPDPDRAALARASPSRRRPTEAPGRDGPRASSRTAGRCRTPPRTGRRRRGRAHRRAARHGPWRRRAGRSEDRLVCRSRSAGDPRAARPRDPRRTSTTSGARSLPSRSPAPRRPAAADPALAKARARPCTAPSSVFPVYPIA